MRETHAEIQAQYTGFPISIDNRSISPEIAKEGSRWYVSLENMGRFFVPDHVGKTIYTALRAQKRLDTLLQKQKFGFKLGQDKVHDSINLMNCHRLILYMLGMHIDDITYYTTSPDNTYNSSIMEKSFLDEKYELKTLKIAEEDMQKKGDYPYIIVLHTMSGEAIHSALVLGRASNGEHILFHKAGKGAVSVADAGFRFDVLGSIFDAYKDLSKEAIFCDVTPFDEASKLIEDYVA